VGCSVGSTAVVLFNGMIFVDESILALVHAIDYDHVRPRFQPPEVDLGCVSCKLTPPKPPIATDLTMVDALLNAHLNDRVPLSDYKQFDKADSDGRRLCLAQIQKVPEELLGLRRSLHCVGDPDSPALPLTVRVLDGPSPACGNDKNVVGCESSGSIVELDARDFTYVTHERQAIVFGVGPDKIDLQVVLLHEMGHWAGIKIHLQTPKNIMSEYINLAQCIDDAVVSSLSEAVAHHGKLEPLALRFYRPPATTVR
jgi:hypothetical protein